MLFRFGQFKSAAGLDLDWKIDCDALADEDWRCVAAASIGQMPTFGCVLGVPTGGASLARAFAAYVTPDAPRTLIVDDVWTTGKSMHAFAERNNVRPWIGFVAFARGALPWYVGCFLLTAHAAGRPTFSAQRLLQETGGN